MSIDRRQDEPEDDSEKDSKECIHFKAYRDLVRFQYAFTETMDTASHTSVDFALSCHIDVPETDEDAELCGSLSNGTTCVDALDTLRMLQPYASNPSTIAESEALQAYAAYYSSMNRQNYFRNSVVPVIKSWFDGHPSCSLLQFLHHTSLEDATMCIC